MRIDVSLLDILEGLSNYDIVKVLAGLYLTDEYGVDVDKDLEDVEEFVETGDDLLTNIQNTFANIDREYSEEDTYDDNNDYEDEDEDEDDDYWDSDDEDEDEDDVDYETQHLIEENRRKNEIALGL